MLLIPEEYKEKILKIEKPNTRKWLKELDNKITKYQKRFKLTNLEVIPKLSINFVLSAYSEAYYRPVILKIGRPGYDTKKEYKMLQLYTKETACECLYQDSEDEVLLLEKLEPGVFIGTIEDRKDRVKEFVRILRRTQRDIPTKEEFPYYNDIVKQYFQTAMKDKNQYAKIIDFIPMAWEYYQDIHQNTTQQYLLHGDLNSKNILKSGNTWKVIDPQGYIGEEVVGVVKFVRDEMNSSENRMEQLEQTIYYLANEMQIPEEKIAKITFVELIRVNCWKISEKQSETEINAIVKMAEVVQEYIKKKQSF